MKNKKTVNKKQHGSSLKNVFLEIHDYGGIWKKTFLKQPGYGGPLKDVLKKFTISEVPLFI